MQDTPSEARTAECWRCRKQRYIFESCHRCGASCKPLTAYRQHWEKHNPADVRG